LLNQSFRSEYDQHGDIQEVDGQPLSPADVLITDRLATRKRKRPNLTAEVAAFREISALLVQKPERAVKRFLELAVVLCDAGSSGLSLLEDMPEGGRQFRWDAMAGPLEVHVGGTTPVDFSPCGMCLDRGHTILVSRPFRAFPYFGVAVQPLMEGLVVPLYDTGGVALGTIWIVHHDETKSFDAEDARVMEQLAIQLVLALKVRDEISKASMAEALRAENAALSDSGAFLRGVLASSGDCIKVLDLDANLIFMSEGGQRVMDVSDFNAIRGCSWPGFWQGQARTDALDAIEVAKAGGVGRFQNPANTMAGTPRWWDVQVTPIQNTLGEIENLLCVSRDITEQKRVEDQLALSETALRLATEAAEIGTWDLDLTTNVLVWSNRTKAIFGISPDVPCSMDDFYAGLHPDDLAATTHAFASALDPAQRATYDVEYRTVGKEDGVIRWVAAKGRGMFDDEGRCIRALGTAIDITARKQAEDHQRLLTNELNHRMKNTLAMVQAIGNQTMRTTGGDMAEVRAAFNARLQALGKAQDVLTRTSWSKAGLWEVVSSTLEPHGGRAAGRFTIDGPDLPLSAKCALAMALALHELATNAAKYGALSDDAGGVRVAWTATGPRNERQFRFEWQEHGGPRVKEPSRVGFGSRMIERSLAGYFKGSARLSYEPEGVVFSLEAPLSALTIEE
jgi:PAS domain S-box-containing protein